LVVSVSDHNALIYDHQESSTTADEDIATLNKNNKSGKFSWGFLKYVTLIFIAPAFLNHASLYRESRGLQPDGMYMAVI